MTEDTKNLSSQSNDSNFGFMPALNSEVGRAPSSKLVGHVRAI